MRKHVCTIAADGIRFSSAWRARTYLASLSEPLRSPGHRDEQMTASTSRYLLVIRYPTGGIRTHVKYAKQLAPNQPIAPAPVLICPDDADGKAIAQAAGIPGAQVSSKGAKSFSDLLIATLRACMRYRPRVIHSHGFTSALAAAPSALLLHKRHIVTIHDVVTPGLVARTPKLVLMALGLVLRSAYAVHAVGEDCAENLCTLPFMNKARNILTIQNGINSAQFSHVSPTDIRLKLGLPSDTFLVGFFGRFMAQKGFRTLIDAMLLVSQRAGVRKVVVIAVGGGGFIREETAYIERLQLQECFRFLDSVENPAPLIAGVDCVAMPSRWEAYPLLAAEALALGIPLVASNCLGLREVTRDTPAISIVPDNPAILADAICEEAVDSTKRIANAFAATALKRFDFAPNAARLLELLVAAHNGEPRPNLQPSEHLA